VAGCGNSSIMIATTAPGDKSNMIVTTSHPGTWTRTIDVYVPPNYVRGAEAPFIVISDGGSTAWKDVNTVLDNLIQQRRVPSMISIQIGNGGQDAQEPSVGENTTRCQAPIHSSWSARCYRSSSSALA
jgi:enterochelin esterase-like enzyme